MKGSRPSRPAEGFSDVLWRAVTKCWADSHNRPTIQAFMDELSMVEKVCSDFEPPPVSGKDFIRPSEANR